MINSTIDIPIAKKERMIINAKAVLSYTSFSSFCWKLAINISPPRKRKMIGQSLNMISKDNLR
jgi:hypothetical protein